MSSSVHKVAMSPSEHPHRAGRLDWRRLLGWSRRRPIGWRIATPLAFAAAGMLAMTSMVNSQGTDLRSGRHTSLAELVSAQSTQVERLRRDAQQLESQVLALTSQVPGGLTPRLERQLATLQRRVGLEPVRGAGLKVTLDDAPADQPISDEVDPNWLVVHQQDIQAVVNALWAGGAKAISLQGQRVISTTGIKCVGNTVVLQGVPYAPPYEIVAVGPVGPMYDALTTSPQVQSYRRYVQAPYNLGWTLRQGENLRIPAYSGTMDLQYAQPAEAP